MYARMTIREMSNFAFLFSRMSQGASNENYRKAFHKVAEGLTELFNLFMNDNATGDSFIAANETETVIG